MHPASYPLLYTIGPHIRFRPSLRSPRRDTVAFRYPLALPTWGRTNSLIRNHLPFTLAAYLKIGTLAKRTDKQLGIPGTQQGNR